MSTAATGTETADSAVPSEPALGEGVPFEISQGASSGNVTRLLSALRKGDRQALDRLFEIVYAELKRLAKAQLALAPGDSTLSTTALVNEAYVKFARAAELSASDREHFYSLASRAMRQILVDHCRRRLADRRGGGAVTVPLEDWDGPAEVDLTRVVMIDAALTKLAKREPRLAELVERRVFAGLTLEEIAKATNLSATTLKRDWRKARAFLYRELTTPGP